MGRRVVGKCWRKTVLMVTFVRTNLLPRMPSSCARAKRKIIKNLCLPASGPAAYAFLPRCWCDIGCDIAAAATWAVWCKSDHRNLQFGFVGYEGFSHVVKDGIFSAKNRQGEGITTISSRP